MPNSTLTEDFIAQSQTNFSQHHELSELVCTHTLPTYPPKSTLLCKRPASSDLRPSKHIKTSTLDINPSQSAPRSNLFFPAELLPELTKKNSRTLISNLDVLLRSTTLTDSVRIKALHSKATHLQKLEQYEESIECFTECLKMDANNIEFLYGRGESYRLSGNYVASKSDLSAALELDSTSLNVLIRYIALMVDGYSDFDLAKRYTLIAHSLHPRDVTLRLFAKKLNLHLPAEAPSAKASADSLFLLGRRQFADEQYTLALESFTRAIAVDPTHSPSLLGRGNVYRIMGTYSKALEDFQACLELKPGFPAALFGVAFCDHVEKRYEKALVSLNQLLEIDQNFIKAIYLRADVNRKLQHFAAALKDLDQLVQSFYSLQVDVATLSQKTRSVISGVFARRGLVGFQAKRSLDSVLGDFSMALQLNPEDVFIFNSLGYIYYEVKDYEKAEYYLCECLNRSPKNIDALVTYGKVLHVQKRFEDAAAAFNQVIAASTKYRVVYYYLYRVYIEGGEHKLAVDTINTIMSLNPDAKLSTVRDKLLAQVDSTSQASSRS